MDSFFCPNLTLFSQQYFVCDWYYNVDCSSAPNYFSLNQALYNQPDISRALYTNFQGDISRALQLTNPGQVDLQEGASEVSRSLNNLVTQLDGKKSGIVEEIKVESKQIVGNIRRGNYLYSEEDQRSIPTYKRVVTTAATYEEIINDGDKESSKDSYTTVDYTDTADPEPIAGQFIDNGTGYNQLDDQGSDPEPAPEVDSDPNLSTYQSSPDANIIYQSDPSLYSLSGSYSNTGSNYNSGSALGSYANTGSGLVDNSHSRSNPDSQIASYSASASNSGSSKEYYSKSDVYDSADPEPTPYYDYYDSADPEPSAPSATYDDSSSSLSTYDDSSAYADPYASAPAYDDSSADPEPSPGYYQTSGDDTEPGADPEDSP